MKLYEVTEEDLSIIISLDSITKRRNYIDKNIKKKKDGKGKK